MTTERLSYVYVDVKDSARWKTVFIPVYVDGKYGVTATAVLIHVMRPDCPILQALLQHSQQVIQLGTFDTGDRIFRQNISANPEEIVGEICFKNLNRLSTTKALLRLFQRTVRFDRFAPGLSKSMTWRRNKTKIGEI